MTAFDPALAYREDWRYHDFIETADYQPPPTGEAADEAFGLKVKKLDATDSGYQSVALALGLSAEDTVLVVWMPVDDNKKVRLFNPESNGRLILSSSAETWTIDRLRKSRFGHWEMGVTKATENASAAT